jgi:hypothetical protein
MCLSAFPTGLAIISPAWAVANQTKHAWLRLTGLLEPMQSGSNKNCLCGNNQSGEGGDSDGTKVFSGSIGHKSPISSFARVCMGVLEKLVRFSFSRWDCANFDVDVFANWFFSWLGSPAFLEYQSTVLPNKKELTKKFIKLTLF